jgi:hypothetical protein
MTWVTLLEAKDSRAEFRIRTMFSRGVNPWWEQGAFAHQYLVAVQDGHRQVDTLRVVIAS